MRWGFTGAKKGTTEMIILRLLRSLKLTPNDVVITGACIGIDAQVAIMVNKHYPKVPQLIVVPANVSRVDTRVYDLAPNVTLDYMPEGSSYRDRNKRLVDECDNMVAFWSGSKIHSGTYMTMNEATRVKKLHSVVKI